MDTWAGPFPQMRRPSFLGPGPDTDSEGGPDEAFRRDGFDAPRPPPAAPSSSVSGRLGEAALRGGEAIIAAGATGVAQAVERFGFRNAERAAAQVEQRVLPRIIGRPADVEQLIIRAGQRAQDVERAAAADIEQFAAEQAAAEGRALRRPRRQPQRRRAVAYWRAWRRRAAQRRRARAQQRQQPSPSPKASAWQQAWSREARQPLPAAPLTGCIEEDAGCRWLLSGNGGDAASSSGGEFQDIRTLNNMQQGTPQERFSMQQPRVQQPMVSRLNSSEDDAPMAQQQEQPRPQVRSRPAPQPRMPFGLNQVSSSGSESYGPVRRSRPQRVEPSFNELRREALAREPEAA